MRPTSLHPQTEDVPERIRKLAGSRESAKRFLRSVISSQATYPGSSSSTSVGESEEPKPPGYETDRPRIVSVQYDTMHADVVQPNGTSGGGTGVGGVIGAVGGPVSGMLTRPHLAENVRTASSMSTTSNGSNNSTSMRVFGGEKPVACGNGIVAYICLAEPTLFLQGFEPSETGPQKTAMLRGKLVIRVSKSAKLKAVNLTFRGRSKILWPEGVPTKKGEYVEESVIRRHTWPFFNVNFKNADDHGADAYHPATAGASSLSLQFPNASKSTFEQYSGLSTPSTNNLSVRDQKRLSLQVNQSRSFGKGDSATGGPSMQQKGYLTFHPGEYIYHFELPLDCHLPETIELDQGSVRYDLELEIERAGAFRSNVVGSKEVPIIRAPAESSLEQVEPIAISRNWEDQLHYDIVISGKSFPLGAQVPIAFKLTPLAKVQCHRIKVFVTEHISLYTESKRRHREEPVKKLQLFEKRADSQSHSTFPGSSIRITSGGGIDYDHRAQAARGNEQVNRDNVNLLGNLDGEHNIGPTEMEFSVQLPSCDSNRERDPSHRLHFDTTYPNIQVHHWIKIVMRLSKPDVTDPAKRRHFEISIDSPFHILSCLATQANMSLPAYSSPNATPNITTDSGSLRCCCAGGRQRQTQPISRSSRFATNGQNVSTTNTTTQDNYPTTPQRPAAAHIDATGGVPRPEFRRPMHMLRNPSFNPPAFDAEMPPPPLMTPPPNYDSIVGEGSGLADYFARLADEVGDEDTENGTHEDDDDDDDRAASRRGRVNLPLTPGGRINRSMDERRTWTTVG